MQVFVFRSLFLGLATWILCGCYALQLDRSYKGPPQRPSDLESYYSRGTSYSSYTEKIIAQNDRFTQYRITLQSPVGETTIDYFATPKPNDDLVLVFPLLGGKNMVVDYFASYYAGKGFDAAIVHRNEEFKNPENFDRLEELFRANVVRDRIALDFFEKVHGKRDFGSFGISRGAINVAITAGVDPRLRYNVMAMGGTDIVELFRHSGEKRIKKIREEVMRAKGMSEEQFYQFLQSTIRTDPKNLALYIDARETLLFLALFDDTVPIEYGIKLRQQIGKPKTVYLFADHFTSAAFTQFVQVMPEESPIKIPFDYIEKESLEFYRRSFNKGHRDFHLLPLQLLQLPINFVAELINKIF